MKGSGTSSDAEPRPAAPPSGGAAGPSESSGTSRGAAARLAVLAAVLLASLVALHATPLGRHLHDLQVVKDDLRETGPLAFACFTILTTVLVAAGMPRLWCSALGGMLLGFGLGLPMSLVGSLAGSYAAFLFARWAGRDWASRYLGRTRVARRLGTPTVAGVFWARQLPIAGVAINTALGLTPVRHGVFLLGSLLGFLPLATVVTLIGSGLVKTSPAAAALQIGLACAAAPLLLLILRRAHGASSIEAPEGPRVRLARWLPALVALVAGLTFQGSRGIYDTTEGRYALSAREMADGGNWLEPTLLGEHHWTKPPMAYWLVASGIRLAGRDTWGTRIPIALVFVLTTLSVVALAETIRDRTTGILAGVVYATSAYPVLVASTINTDTLLSLWAILAVLCFWRAERAEHRSAARRWLLGMWAVLGLGFLTKGPPALIVLLPVLIHRGMDPRRRDKPRVLQPLGLLLFLIVGGWWYVLECARNPGLLRYFVGDEVIGRVATDMHGRGSEWYYLFLWYVPAMLLGAGAWTPWLAALVRRHALWRPSTWRSLARAHRPSWFLLVWVAVPFAIFSAARSRMPAYLLPLFPAIALAIAWHIRSRWEDPRTRRWTVRTAAAAGLVVLTVKAAPAYLSHPRRDMTALYALARPEEEVPGTRLVWYEKHAGYGLDFHAREPIERTYASPPSGVPGSSIDDFLHDRVLGPPGEVRRYVFVADTRSKGTLLGLLAAHGIEATVARESEHWSLIRVVQGFDHGPAAAVEPPPGPPEPEDHRG